MKTCIFCNSSNNVNTTLNLNIDGDDVQVHICDEHAEEASIGSAKKAYYDRQNNIQKLLEQAKALGLDTSQFGQAPIVVSPAPPVASPAPPVASPAPPVASPAPPVASPAPIIAEAIESQEVQERPKEIPSNRPPNVIDAKKVDLSQNPRFKASGANVQSFNSHSINDLKDKLDDTLLDGEIEINEVSGRASQNIIIPTQRRDGTGVTTIRVKKVSNQELADATQKAIQDEVAFKDGYSAVGETVRKCPLCRGKRILPNGNTCPKCSGSGEIII